MEVDSCIVALFSGLAASLPTFMRSLTKTSQLFQEESSYKLFGWNKVA